MLIAQIVASRGTRKIYNNRPECFNIEKCINLRFKMFNIKFKSANDRLIKKHEIISWWVDGPKFELLIKVKSKKFLIKKF